MKQEGILARNRWPEQQQNTEVEAACVLRSMPSTGGTTVPYFYQSTVVRDQIQGRGIQTALLSETCQRIFGPCSHTSQYSLDFILVWNSVFTLTSAQSSFPGLFIYYFCINLTHFGSYSQEGQRLFGVRCFLERSTLCTGLLGTILIYASCLCVIIYGAHFC